jgi:hypothetical protein
MSCIQSALVKTYCKENAPPVHEIVLMSKPAAARSVLDLDDNIAEMRKELELLKLVIQKVEALIPTGPKKFGGSSNGIVEIAKSAATKRQRRPNGMKDKMP